MDHPLVTVRDSTLAHSITDCACRVCLHSRSPHSPIPNHGKGPLCSCLSILQLRASRCWRGKTHSVYEVPNTRESKHLATNLQNPSPSEARMRVFALDRRDFLASPSLAPTSQKSQNPFPEASALCPKSRSADPFQTSMNF